MFLFGGEREMLGGVGAGRVWLGLRGHSDADLQMFLSVHVNVLRTLERRT